MLCLMLCCVVRRYQPATILKSLIWCNPVTADFSAVYTPGFLDMIRRSWFDREVTRGSTERLIVIHAIGRVDVSINKFFGSFLNLFWAFTLIFKEISYFTLFQKKANFAFFYVWFSLFVLTRVIGRGSNIVIFFNGRQNKTFKPSSKFFHNGRLINLSVDFFGKTSRFPVIF